MGKMWAGLNEARTSKLADDFNSSFSFDSRMFKQDITGSMAHAAMLGTQGIIGPEDAETIINGLREILKDFENASGADEWFRQNQEGWEDSVPEDIHMFVEQILTDRLGDVGKKLHTARSRNDQVAVDMRLYLRDEIEKIKQQIRELLETIVENAAKYSRTILPGYTHLQRAQPIMFGHHLMAYAQMFLRDRDRLTDCEKRMNISPLGSCALAGTTYPTDRKLEARELGFEGVCANSLDGVSDRDFCVEFLSAASILMMHLSRLSEELILWSSWEFKFITLSDAYTTGSSIMPQKKNPDMAELIRGKTGRVYGDLMGSLTMLKGIPLAYNKDMQEDKESLFDAVDTLEMCIPVMTGMLSTMTVHADTMRKAAEKGFINATDLADYLVSLGLPFRSAYKISGSIVADCIATGQTLETYPLSSYQEAFGDITEAVYDFVNLETCVEKRTSEGGTSPLSVEKQIELVKELL